MNASRYHTIVRTIVLVDIPTGMFLLASAIIGWPIALTKPELFFWFGFIAFSSVTVFGIAKLGNKTFQSIQRENADTRVYIEQQRQSLLPPPYPKDNYYIENEDVETVSQPSRTRETLIPSQSVSQKPEDMLDNCNRDVAIYLVKHPGASIRQIERDTRYSRASIGRTMAWRERSR